MLGSLTRTFIAGAVAVTGILLSGGPVAADTTTTNAYKGDGKIGTTVETKTGSGSTAGRRIRSMSEEECITERIKTQVEGLLMVGEDGEVKPLYDEEHKEDQGAWYRRVCYVGYNQTAYRVYWVANIDPAALAQQALAEAPLPDPVIAISAELPAVTLVGYPQWMWIDRAAWRTVNASASLDGLTAAVNAVPHRVSWDSGDSRAPAAERVLHCDNPGKPLSANAGYDERMSGSDCTYRYLHTSGKEKDLAFNLTATIYWHVTWTATNGTNGDLGFVSRDSSIPIKVGENQVVNVLPQELER